MTLRQEIENLIEKLKDFAAGETTHSSHYDQGKFDGYRFAAKLLTAILSTQTEPAPPNGTIADMDYVARHTTPPTAPSQREQASGCELMTCKYYVDGKCTDPNDWVNESGDAVCGLRTDAILVENEHSI